MGRSEGEQQQYKGDNRELGQAPAIQVRAVTHVQKQGKHDPENRRAQNARVSPTQDLIAAARPLGLSVLDHMIVGAETTYSFADRGVLDELESLCLTPGDTRRKLK